MKKKNERIEECDDGKVTLRFFNSKGAKKRMICFPFIGGHSVHYRQLVACLPVNIEVIAIDPPGHGLARHKLVLDFEEMIDLYWEALQPWLVDDLFIFGHSLGGLTAYAIARRMEEKGFRLRGIFISASLPPSRIEKSIKNENYKIDEEYVREALGKLGDKYSSVKNSSYLFFYMPLIKADYKVLQSCNLKADRLLETPTYISHGTEDLFVDLEDVGDWNLFCQNTSHFQIEGDHNYIIKNPEQLARIIKLKS